ncbi:MAG: response regulator transcription factor [Bacteroidales bacterium]|jgi:DNA-binding response OmpR family regulator|nr:response regulator transcription factor [Bacteroidales bacterium]
MKQVKVLLAEPDLNLGPILKQYLDKNGYQTSLVTDGESAMKHYSLEDVDFVISEATLPLLDGIKLLETIRTLDRDTPVILLSEDLLTNDDKVKAYEAGVDDYIAKPYFMDEVLYRMKAIEKRLNKVEHQNDIFPIGELYTFDFNLKSLFFKGTLVDPACEYKLTGKESQLLRILCINAGQTVDRVVILQKIWKSDTYFNARSMDVYITKLRKHFSKDPNVDLVNQHGIGFKLIIN